MKNKKGAIQEIQALIVPLVGVAIVLVVGFLIIAEAQTQIQSIEGLNSSGASMETGEQGGSLTYNASQDVQNAMADIPGWLPIIVITVIGAVLLGLVSYFRK